MRKYWSVFKISWSRILAYRFNFFLGRLRNIIILLLLFYVWQTLTLKTGAFAGYTEIELMTYVFGVNILRSIIFGGQSREIAEEINSGDFSRYLVCPINFFWFNFFRELAQRSANLISAIIEVVLFIVILNARIIIQTDWLTLLLFITASIFAVFLYYIISYLASLLAFWSREAMGPRFMIEWFLEFASGAFFPLNILSPLIFWVLLRLPFFYIIYLPISIYLGKYNYDQLLFFIVLQVMWILLLGLITNIVWRSGLKRYSGEGI
ncbi:MAG: ABC-2 family transporter protein, partial [Elusimicrobiales bacterium]|nr:ABC-2 family transporter protein [Elusimicrobiales bacterium]